MRQRLKHTSAVLLVLLLLLPSLVKLEHHHKHFVCHAKNEKHLHDYHKKCEICCFEYSVFVSDGNISVTEKNEFPGVNLFCYYSSPYSNFLEYSFLLRGPPAVTGNA